MPDQRALRTVEGCAILLFFLQGLRVLLSSLFGLAYDVVFAQRMGAAELAAVGVCVLAAFVAPLLAPRRKERLGLLVSATLAAAARVLMTVNQPDLRLWSSILVTGLSGLFAATFLRRRPDTFAASLALAFAMDQLLRAAGNTYDVSLRARWLPVQVLLSGATCTMSWLLFSRHRKGDRPLREGGIDIPSGLCLGALIFLNTSLLGFPNVLGRWTGADYALVAPLLMAATLLPLLRSARWGGFALFVLTLLIGWLTDHRLHQLALLAPMLLAQRSFVSSLRTLAEPSEGERPRLAFALGMTLFLLLNVALAFAFTYPYTFSFFRGKGDYVFLIAVAILLIPALASGAAAQRRWEWSGAAPAWGAAAGLVLVTVVLAQPPRLERGTAGTESFRVGTYNIHYGFDSNWRFTLEEQARTIEESGADLVLLQEVDAGRMTSYGIDDALWLARRLGMRHVFGPALEDLSGVALLSRFPIQERRTEHLTSELEQTAIVHAQVLLDQSDPTPRLAADVYGTWLGLEPDERARQLKDALKVMGDASPAILGGDFNATPGSPVYESLCASGFTDPFAAIGREGSPTSPAIDPKKRIDFIWTRGLEAKDAQVLDSLASDHRMVVVELAVP